MVCSWLESTFAGLSGFNVVVFTLLRLNVHDKVFKHCTVSYFECVEFGLLRTYTLAMKMGISKIIWLEIRYLGSHKQEGR
jgi:hypothetical protein